MRVRLISCTDVDVLKNALIEKGLKPNPLDLLDHVVYTFEIEDCSRITSHQLVRHRIASYDQESQRFSSATREGFVVPPSIESKEMVRGIYDQALQSAYLAFEKLVAAGIPKEDARYVLPSGIKTKLMMTVNARSLMHIVWQRTALQAQWEIRDLAKQMHSLAREATPWIWTTLVEK